jgi:VIT1/CCC1 family predicted Fe2+/Mn2+ transporter
VNAQTVEGLDRALGRGCRGAVSSIQRRGAVWLIGGVVMLAVGFFTDHLSRGLVSSLFWVILGAGTLAVGTGLRRRNRRAAEQVGGEPDREPGSVTPK